MSMRSWSELVTREIRGRYWIAVGLIALFMTASHFILWFAVRTEREGIRLVELAAEQQVSSQRIPFLANALADEENVEEREYYRNALRTAIRNMAERHRSLSLHKPPEMLSRRTRSILNDIYHHGQFPFDQEVGTFLENARAVAEASGKDLQDGMPPLLKLNHAGSRSIMHTHKLIHHLLEQEEHGAVQRILSLGTVLWLLTLLLLGGTVLFIFRPMTRRTEKSLRLMALARGRARRKATAADAAREGQASFVRSMSHELRTPLNAILGMSQLLQMDLSREKRNEYARDIHQAGEHLLGLINDILEFSRLEAGQVTVEERQTSLRAELEWTVSLLRPLAEAKGLALSCRTEGRLAEFYLADGPRIRQILVNLTGNAIKFTREGAVTVRAFRAGTAGTDADLIRFEVKDTGIGIPRDVHERIFGEFQQADASLARKYGGSGLGLAISSRLVRLMGGEIGVESAEGKGSLFWFTLPLRRPEAAAAGESPARRVHA
ncbi:MAG: sensor histidine kinase [Alphaproteobacteria bacterium]